MGVLEALIRRSFKTTQNWNRIVARSRRVVVRERVRQETSDLHEALYASKF